MKKVIKCLAALSASIAVLLSVTPLHAEEDYGSEKNGITVIADGWEYDGRVFVLNDTAYVSLREFACMADNSVVSWNEETRTAYVDTPSMQLSAKENDYYINANGRILWCEHGIFTLEDGYMYVPLQQIAKAFGFDRDYDESEHTTYLTRMRGSIVSGDEYYDSDELYWLSKIINAEAGGEPFLGKLAVGTVILNRVDSDEFPDSIYDVIFDNKHGVQFTPTMNGAISADAGYDSILAAKITLEDTRLSHNILYFLNEELATSFWIVENCKFVMSIGCHDFYAP